LATQRLIHADVGSNAEKTGTMSIEEKTKRLLLARSGGFCGNPNCNADLYPLFESREITNVEELAHIIGQAEEGPRGDEDLEIESRDDFNNIILLCPTCHRRIDKFPKLYPVLTIQDWKKNHENRIIELFKIPKFDSREKARKEIEKILLTNKIVFDTFGPYSKKAEENLIETEKIWEQKSIDTIIPNNRKMNALMERNYELLTEGEKYLYEEWKQHKESFEFNKLSGDKTSAIVIYPIAFNSILKDE